MKNIKEYIIEGFYKNVGIKELKEWYDLNDKLTKSKNTLHIDKDTNELVVKFNWNDEVRVSILKYLEWLKDYKYIGMYQCSSDRMDISWEKATLDRKPFYMEPFKTREHIDMIVNKGDNTLTLTYSEGGRNSKKLYDGEI